MQKVRFHARAWACTLLRSMTLWCTTGRMTECQREDQRSSGCGRLVARLLRIQPPMSACSAHPCSDGLHNLASLNTIYSCVRSH